MIIDPVGSSKKKYRKRIQDAKKKAIGEVKYYQLGGLKRGQPIIVTIPIIHIPHIEYGPWAPGVASGPGEEGDPLYPGHGDDEDESHEGGKGEGDAIYEEMAMKDLINYLKDELELEMIKPGKRKKKERTIYPAYSPRGPDSLFDLDETIDAMMERHIVQTKMYKRLENELMKNIEDVDIKIVSENYSQKDLETLKDEKAVLESRLSRIRKDLTDIEFEKGQKLKIKIDDDDLRYKTSKIIWKEEKDAILINFRDLSGSITKEDLEASWTVSKLTDIWLKDAYKDSQVDVAYVPHNDWAWEETEEGYYKLMPNGGTSFTPAYEIVHDMIKGNDYPRNTQVKRNINPEETDIYIVQYSDGGNWDTDAALDSIERLLPHVTRFCYLETSFGDWKSEYYNKLKERFSDKINDGSVRLYRMQKQEQTWDALKTFFGKRGG